MFWQGIALIVVGFLCFGILYWKLNREGEPGFKVHHGRPSHSGPSFDPAAPSSATTGRLVEEMRRRRVEHQTTGEPVPAKDQAVAAATVHTLFAHRALPSLGFENPSNFLNAVAGPMGEQLLREVWADVCQQTKIETEPAPASFPIQRFMLGNEFAVLIELPAPRHVPEPYFVVFVTELPKSADELPLSSERARARYFTLEKSHDELAELLQPREATSGDLPATVLGEWTLDGSHHNYGFGPPPDWKAFASVLVQRFARSHE